MGILIMKNLSLEKNTALTVLDLSGNEIGGGIIENVSSYLKRNVKLSELLKERRRLYGVLRICWERAQRNGDFRKPLSELPCDILGEIVKHVDDLSPAK